MKPPLLSICIPTFNRLAYLRELLPVVIAEVAEANRVEARVELLISDNASTDGTEAYARGQVHAWLVYRRNPTNIGGDRNFLACVAHARGDYVWLLGDDDLLASGGLARVLHALAQHAPGLLILPTDERAGGDADSRVYPGYAACLRQEGVAFAMAHTLISSNVFRSKLFDLTRATAMLPTNYGHMYGLIDGLQPDAPVAVLEDVVRVRPVRAQFDRWPAALCAKQARYLWHVSVLFGVPRLRSLAFRLALNLPVEIAGRCLRRISPRFGRT